MLCRIASSKAPSVISPPCRWAIGTPAIKPADAPESAIGLPNQRVNEKPDNASKALYSKSQRMRYISNLARTNCQVNLCTRLRYQRLNFINCLAMLRVTNESPLLWRLVSMCTRFCSEICNHALLNNPNSISRSSYEANFAIQFQLTHLVENRV